MSKTKEKTDEKKPPSPPIPMPQQRLSPEDQLKQQASFNLQKLGALTRKKVMLKSELDSLEKAEEVLLNDIKALEDRMMSLQAQKQNVQTEG